jgi:hypothetical protein
MRRWITALFSLTLLAGPADAKKPPKPKKPVAGAVKAAPAVPAANEKAVSELMGPWKWGMTVEEVLAVLGKQLTERKAAELAKMTDVYEQTQARKAIKKDVDAVRQTLVKFEGQRTGWDVSIIEGEFLHKNNESMMNYRETDPASGRDQQRFFFFQEGRLWKQFIAFNMEPYKGKTFDDFRQAMESRYGAGRPITKVDREGKEKTVAVAWRAPNTYLRAIDLMQFYSNFCLAFSDASVEERMDVLRADRASKISTPRASVTDAAGEDKVNDPNADVIDRITAEKPPEGSSTSPDKPQ